MSYVIHLWDQPTPATWMEAQAVLARQVDQPAPPGHRWLALALERVEHGQRLVNRVCWWLVVGGFSVL